MKQYLSLSSVKGVISQIIPVGNKTKGKSTKREKPFVVLNTDDDYGFYVKRLAREIAKYPELEQQPKILRRKSLKNISTGDLIVFGDMLGSVDYDYRVETEPKNLDHLDGRLFKVYDLISDWSKVIERLKKYVVANYHTEKLVGIFEDDDDVKETNVNIKINVNTLLGRTPKYRTAVSFIRPTVKEEKVTIFDNWVKVGYNQYDIYCNMLGEEFIYIDGYKFFVKSDKFGRKYLTK